MYASMVIVPDGEIEYHLGFCDFDTLGHRVDQ